MMSVSLSMCVGCTMVSHTHTSVGAVHMLQCTGLQSGVALFTFEWSVTAK